MDSVFFFFRSFVAFDKLNLKSTLENNLAKMRESGSSCFWWAFCYLHSHYIQLRWQVNKGIKANQKRNKKKRERIEFVKVIRHHLDAGEEVLLVKCLKLVKCGWCWCCFACIFWILSKVNSNFFALIEWMTRDVWRVMRNRCFGILINDDFGGKFGNTKHFKVFYLNVSIAFRSRLSLLNSFVEPQFIIRRKAFFYFRSFLFIHFLFRFTLQTQDKLLTLSNR